MRQIQHDYFRGLAISCDASGAQDRTATSVTGNVHSMFTPAAEYIKAGFDMRACHRTDNDKPANPEKLAQEIILHGLLRRNDLGQLAPRYAEGDPSLPPSIRFLVNGPRCPELVKSLQEQARNDRGFRRKRSDTRDDRLSDVIDAVLYGLWPHFSEIKQPSASVRW